VAVQILERGGQTLLGLGPLVAQRLAPRALGVQLLVASPDQRLDLDQLRAEDLLGRAVALQVGGSGLHALLEARGLVAERLEALARLLELFVARGQRVPQGGSLLTELVHDAALRRNLALQLFGLQARPLCRVRARLGLLPRGLERLRRGLQGGLGLSQLLRPGRQGLTVPGQVLGQGRERSGLLLDLVAQGELLLAEGLQLGHLLGDQLPVLVELVLEVLRELLALAEVLLQPLEPLAAGLLLLGALLALGLEGRAMLGEVALGVAQPRAVPL